MAPRDEVPSGARPWLVWLEPALVVLLAPVLLFPSPRRSWLFTFLLLIFVLHLAARRRTTERSPLNVPLALLLLMVGVSAWATHDIALSLPKIAGVLLGAALLLSIVNCSPSPRIIAILLSAFFAGGVTLSAMGLLGTNWIAKVPVLGNITSLLPAKIRGLQGAEEGFQPNGVAGGLILFIPAQLTLLVCLARRGGARRETLAVGFSLAMTLGVVLLTQSRGGWVGLAAGLVLLAAWASRKGRILALGVILVVAVVVFWVGPTRAVDGAMQAIGSTSSVAGTIDGRLEVWNRALYGIGDFPFSGMGMNTFRKLVHLLYPLYLTVPDVDIAHCHNQLLQTALDLGIPGLVAYVMLLAAAVVMGCRTWRRDRDGWMGRAAQGLVCGIVAQQVFGLTDAIALGAKVGVFFWVALALIATMYRVSTNGVSR
jgi:putative inorganic carbon (hco3(-)) transporter